MKKGLLLGAGFSYDFGMPLASELTDVFLGLFSGNNTVTFLKQLSQQNPYGEKRPININALAEGVNVLLKHKIANSQNYEQVLEEIQALGDNPQATQSDRDSFNYLFTIFYEIIHQILSAYQVESYSVLYKQNLKWFEGFKNILSPTETWVFTLNHDLYAECLAVDLRIPVTYGDRGSIKFPISNMDMENIIHFSCNERSSVLDDRKGFFQDEYGINLVKLHGGLSELKYKDGEFICNQQLSKNSSSDLIDEFKAIAEMNYCHQGKPIPSGRHRVVTNTLGELDILENSMLTGGKKYSGTSNPKQGEEKLCLFSEQLLSLEELTIIGYGFGDNHINFRISNAMVLNESLNVRIIDPVRTEKPEFLRQFDYNSRVTGGMCGAPHWFEYLGANKWNTSQMDSLKKNERHRTEIKKAVELKFRK